MHLINVTGATLDSQSQSGVQLSSDASDTLNRQAPVSVSISGNFDPVLLGPSTAGLNVLELQDVMLNDQLCSLTGVQSLNASSPSPDPGNPPQVASSRMLLGRPCLSCKSSHLLCKFESSTASALALSRSRHQCAAPK